MNRRTFSVVCPRCAQFGSVRIARRFDPTDAKHRNHVELHCPAGCALSATEVQELKATGLLHR